MYIELAAFLHPNVSMIRGEVETLSIAVVFGLDIEKLFMLLQIREEY